MKIHTEPLKPLHYYPVYNRGINGCPVFARKENYAYFLQKYALYIAPVAATYAYCLLGNHFHLLIAVRSEPEIMDFFMRRKTDQTGKPYTPVPHTPSAGKVVSWQFSHLFNAYAQAFNKETKRSGGLFETPFRRKPVESSRYLNQVIAYIHQNPQKHRLVSNFADYPHSSYHSFLSQLKTALPRSEVLDKFGGAAAYQNYHDHNFVISENLPWHIEVDD